MKKLQKRKPVVVAMIGLVGSGKTTMARFLAQRLGAIIIDGDEIRLRLRKEGKSYSKVFQVALDSGAGALSRGKSVVLCSDFIDVARRKDLEQLSHKHKIPGYYLRVTCDPDVAVGRVLAKGQGEFFEGAPVLWQGAKRGTVVKLREFWRRTPWHCKWESGNGGHWEPKRIKVTKMFSADTTDGRSWRREVIKVASRLKAR